MLRYLRRRLLWGVIVITGVVTITFVVARLIPGDPAAAWVGLHATSDELARARHTLGLDQPITTQLWDYVTATISGNWGISIHTKRPVLEDLRAYAPASIELVSTALVTAWLIGVPLGLISARRPGGPADLVIRLAAVLGVSMPVFWLALILQLVFFQRLGWFPVAGEYDPVFASTSL